MTKKNLLGQENRVRLIEDIIMDEDFHQKGKEFTIRGSWYRGWELLDDDGNVFDETFLIRCKLELWDCCVTIKSI